MNKNRYYSQAIDILTQDNDWKAICIAIAKINPRLFIEAYGNKPIDVEARALMLSGKKIQAIKLIRKERGITLVEAKNFCEALI